jgi:hypothetical protein
MSKESVIRQIINQMNINPGLMGEVLIDSDYTWESFIVPEGYEKPSKEEFDTKFAELYALEPLRRLREERNFRIQACDYVFISDYVSTLSEEKLNEWRTYRQALRDITIDAHPQLDETGVFLIGVEWPTPPN